MVVGVFFIVLFAVVHATIGQSQVTQLLHGATRLPLMGASTSIDVPPEPIISPPPLPIPELTGELPDRGSLAASAIFVHDRTTGEALYRTAEYEPRPIASITKLMTALVLLDEGLPWEANAVVTSTDVYGSHLFIGDTYTVDDLWNVMLVGSSNKAALTLTELVTSTTPQFIDLMNTRAQELGMMDTRFADPTGLDPANISTAYDVSLLLDEALKHEQIVTALMKKEITIASFERQQDHDVWNTNWLLLKWIPHEFPVLRGGKTGYIPESGYNFAVQIGDDAGHVLSVVVLGAEEHESRFTVARDVAAAVFEAYTWPSSTLSIESL
jgi:D-alanyl-D-alanine carboxypeptidase